MSLCLLSLNNYVDIDVYIKQPFSLTVVLLIHNNHLRLSTREDNYNPTCIIEVMHNTIKQVRLVTIYLCHSALNFIFDFLNQKSNNHLIRRCIIMSNTPIRMNKLVVQKSNIYEASNSNLFINFWIKQHKICLVLVIL